MAAKAPSTIEAMATKTTICCQEWVMPGKRHDGRAHENRDAGHLGRGGKERRHRRRRAFVDVRRPHVERHGGNLEAEAGEQEHQPEDQAEPCPVLRRRGDAGKTRWCR